MTNYGQKKNGLQTEIKQERGSEEEKKLGQIVPLKSSLTFVTKSFINDNTFLIVACSMFVLNFAKIFSIKITT